MTGVVAAKILHSRRALFVAIVAALSSAACGAIAGTAEGSPTLVWYAETSDGKLLDARESDKPVNPASVTKLATSLRALETLGIDHRFETTFSVTGATGDARDLVVTGGADPDFHFENAVIVAHALVAEGITKLRGDLYMGDSFWIGWEHGTAGREPDPVKRRLDMGHRLLAAWTPSTWDADHHRSWEEMAARYKWDASRPPQVSVEGRVRLDPPPAPRTILVHRSEPLLTALHRFNVYSNNDIERLDASIGPASGLSAFLQRRLGKEAEMTSFSTSSGLNRNRVTPHLVVRLLRDLRTWLAAHDRKPADLMPVLGCGESTLPELFPRLRASGEANGLIGKTGTLNLQDGGVSALAGFLPAGPGAVFFVASPGAGADLRSARAAEEDWVRRMLAKLGPVDPLVCPAAVPTSDAQAEITRPAAGQAEKVGAKGGEKGT